MLAVSTDVIMRYWLARPSLWVGEVAEVALLYITFLAAAWVLRKERHTSMDIVLTRLNPRNQAILNTITSIISALICLLLTWYGARATWSHFQLGLRTASIMELPMGPILVIIPVGSFMLFIQFLRRIIRFLAVKESVKNANG